MGETWENGRSMGLGVEGRGYGNVPMLLAEVGPGLHCCAFTLEVQKCGECGGLGGQGRGAHRAQSKDA